MWRECNVGLIFCVGAIISSDLLRSLTAVPFACIAGTALGTIPFPRCQPDGSSRGASAGGKFLNRFGGQRLAADAPLAAGYFGDLHPGHPPHVLAFDRDHGIGQFLNDLSLLLGVEHFFDQRTYISGIVMLLCADLARARSLTKVFAWLPIPDFQQTMI